MTSVPFTARAASWPLSATLPATVSGWPPTNPPAGCNNVAPACSTASTADAGMIPPGPASATGTVKSTSWPLELPTAKSSALAPSRLTTPAKLPAASRLSGWPLTESCEPTPAPPTVPLTIAVPFSTVRGPRVSSCGIEPGRAPGTSASASALVAAKSLAFLAGLNDIASLPPHLCDLVREGPTGSEDCGPPQERALRFP